MNRSHPKGIALILVISALSMLSIMMVEVTLGSRMNLRIAANFTHATQARQLAQSGIHFAMLELTVYKQLRDHPIVRQIPGFNAAILEQIWQFGFIYPPVASKRATFGAEKEMETLKATSHIEGTIQTTLTDESAKINLNDLSEPQHQAGILRLLRQIFDQRKESDEAFYHRYRDLNFEALIGHLIDWVDADTRSVEGGDEERYYSRLILPYKPRNAPLPLLSELYLVEGFEDDEIFNLLQPYLTVYPTGGVNINTADAMILKSLSPELTEADVEAIIEHREHEGYFQTPQAFEEFCKQQLLKSAEFNRNPKVRLTTQSNIFSLISRAEVKGTAQTVRAAVDISSKLPNGAPHLLYWNLP